MLGQRRRRWANIKPTLAQRIVFTGYYANMVHWSTFNPLTAGVAYIRVSIFYEHIKYHILNMLKIKCDIKQQYLKTVDLHFVKSE